MNGFREENLRTVKALLNKATPNERNALIGFLNECELGEKRLRDQLRDAEARADMMTKRALSKDKRRMNSVATAGRLRERRNALINEIGVLNRQIDAQATEIQRLQELIEEFPKSKRAFNV